MAAAVLGGAAYAAYQAVQHPRSRFFGDTFTGLAPGRRIVALTFDDGPNGEDTRAILDVLGEEDVHATFFLVGKAAAEQPKTLQRMVRERHALGNHTWDHAHLNLRSRAGIAHQLQRTDDAIYAATGTRTWLARPPFGARSFLVLDELQRLGYTCVLWSTPLAREWEFPGAAAIARRILQRSGDGSIIALHDGNRGRRADRQDVVQAVRMIVRGLRQRGLTFVTIPHMLALEALQ
ncbi:MAG TPA: polysaccharide deacetylase family protein [Candidatus Baltobacteraceae bacterium]